MSRPQPARLGPFTGGINNASDPSMLQDNELVECINMSLDLDGSLVARPPFEVVNAVPSPSVSVKDHAFIGSGILNGIPYVFFSYTPYIGTSTTYAFDGTNNLAVGNFRATKALQYGDVVIFIPSVAGTGGYWDGVTFTTDASMPVGESAVTFKSRIFIVPGKNASGPTNHQLKFSEPVDPNNPTTVNWNVGVNIIPVSPGDGQHLMDIDNYNDNLILFKQDSTYIFVYDTLPTQGTLKLINDNIGASERRSVVSYENSLFVMHEGKVYEIVNYNFNRINEKVPFAFNTTLPVVPDPLGVGALAEFQFPVFLSIFGDKLLVRYFSHIYVYELRTKTWARWEMADQYVNLFGPLIAMPAINPEDFLIKYYSSSSINTNHRFVIQDGYDNTTYEVASNNGTTKLAINCSIQTKIYDFGESFSFKRLTWWGMDCITQSVIAGYVYPVNVRPIATWGIVDNYTWGQIQNAIWAYPNPIGIGVITTTVNDPNLLQRKFVKFLKAIRFRQVYFVVNFSYGGTTLDGPPRFISLTAFIGSKQLVPKQVS